MCNCIKCQNHKGQNLLSKNKECVETPKRTFLKSFFYKLINLLMYRILLYLVARSGYPFPFKNIFHCDTININNITVTIMHFPD